MNNSEYTYRRATAKKRSDRRRRNRQMTVKSLRMVIICSILIFAVSIGGIIVKASDDSNRTRTYKYYGHLLTDIIMGMKIQLHILTI